MFSLGLFLGGNIIYHNMSNIKIDQDFLVSGYVSQCHHDQPEPIFGREEDIYSVTITPDDPSLGEQFLEAYEELAGPYGRKVDASDLIKKDGSLKFETILDPRRLYAGNEPHMVVQGSWADLDVRLEYSTSADAEVVYPRLVLRRAAIHVDPNEFIDWDSVEETYSF